MLGRRTTAIVGLLVALVAAVVFLYLREHRQVPEHAQTTEGHDVDQPGRPVLHGTGAAPVSIPGEAERRGPGQKERIRGLLVAFAEARDEKAHALALELIALGSAAVPTLVEALGSEQEELRAAAAIILGRIGDARPVQHLARCLADESDMVRSYASEALGRIGKPALPVLKPLLAHSEARMRERAAVAVWYMHGDAKGALPEILAALEREQDEDAFLWLSKALVRCGPGAEAAIPHLIGRLSSPSHSITSSASGALGDMGQVAVAPLISVLRATEDDDVAAHAAFALRDLGADAAVAIPALVEGLQRQDFHARRAACDALGAIGEEPEVVVPALASALADPASRVRQHAARALRAYGRGAAPAVPGLLRLLKDEDEDAVSAAVLTLGAIGPDASPAVPFLLARLDGESWGERASAMTALRGIGPAGQGASEALASALEEQELRAYAATALRSVDPERFRQESKRVVPALLEGLNRLNQGLRVSAVEALESLGADAQEALPTLRALLERCRAVERGEDGYQGTPEEVAELRRVLEAAVQTIEAELQGD